MSKKLIIPIQDEKRLTKKVKRAMSRIVLKHPFFAVILLNQEINFTDAIPTMGVDGRTLHINLEFIRKLTPDEVIGVLIHECMHLCWSHVSRRKDRNPALWNYSTDYTINPVIKSEGFTLPTPHLDEVRFHNKTADEIYRILENEQPEINPDLLDLQDSKLSAADKKKLEQDAKVIVAKARQIAGDKTPDAIKKDYETIMDPGEPWETILREFMQTALGDDDVSWRRPNRNYIYQDLYLPSMEGHKLPSIAVCFDTSGSIYSHENLLNSFTNELNNIIQDLAPEQIDVFCIDTKIRSHSTYAEDEMPNYDLAGGGGTDFVSSWQKIEDVNPSCIIFFTDAYATFPESSAVPTIWCVYDNAEPTLPFGKVIIID